MHSNHSTNLTEISIIDDNDDTNITINYINTLLNNTNISRSLSQTKYYHLYPIDQWKLHSLFDEDFLCLVNPHWFDYTPPSIQSHYLLAVIYFLMMVVGISGNGLVIYMIVRFKTLRTPSNILILNLASSDFLIMAKAPVFIFNSLYFGPVLGHFGCQLYGFVGGLSGTSSILTLAAISIDRYFVIAHPLDMQKRPTKFQMIIWIIIIWIYSATFSVIPLMNVNGIKHYVPEGYLTSCSFDYLIDDANNRWYIFVYFLAAWCLPLAVIVISYTSISREVTRVSMARHGQEKEKRKRELKLALVVALVILLWFIAWTPYAIVALLGIFGYTNLITPLGSMIPAIFCKTAACINPFVYALNHPRLRQELFKLFCRERYNFEQTQMARRSTATIISRSSLSQRSDGSPRRGSSISSNHSVSSTQMMELKVINTPLND